MMGFESEFEESNNFVTFLFWRDGNVLSAEISQSFVCAFLSFLFDEQI